MLEILLLILKIFLFVVIFLVLGGVVASPILLKDGKKRAKELGDKMYERVYDNTYDMIDTFLNESKLWMQKNTYGYLCTVTPFRSFNTAKFYSLIIIGKKGIYPIYFLDGIGKVTYDVPKFVIKSSYNDKCLSVDHGFSNCKYMNPALKEIMDLAEIDSNCIKHIIYKPDKNTILDSSIKEKLNEILGPNNYKIVDKDLYGVISAIEGFERNSPINISLEQAGTFTNLINAREEDRKKLDFIDEFDFARLS